MDTYVDSEYCNEILITCKQTPKASETTVEGVIKVAMDVDNCLIRFFREIAKQAETETVREMFRNLVEMKEAELHKHALNALHVTVI